MLSPTELSEVAGGVEGQSQVAAEIAYEMAYGLSHELNNPLANIAGRARLLAEQETDPEKRQQLATIVDQAMRGCEMIADLMLFARPPAWNPTAVDLNALLEELCHKAQQPDGIPNLQVNYSICTTCTRTVVQADRQALSEAIWGLLRNAREVARSRIDVELSQRDSWLIVTITDDGPGLSEHALERAFHPYFSGREAGRGLGLGLSKAQRIASLCGGHVTLENVTPNGCRAVIQIK